MISFLCFRPFSTKASPGAPPCRVLQITSSLAQSPSNPFYSNKLLQILIWLSWSFNSIQGPAQTKATLKSVSNSFVGFWGRYVGREKWKVCSLALFFCLFGFFTVNTRGTWPCPHAHPWSPSLTISPLFWEGHSSGGDNPNQGQGEDCRANGNVTFIQTLEQKM